MCVYKSVLGAFANTELKEAFTSQGLDVSRPCTHSYSRSAAQVIYDQETIIYDDKGSIV